MDNKKKFFVQEYLPLGYYVTQSDWTPTVRTGTIGAEYSSPGPACYMLPPTIGYEGHDCSRKRYPAYSIAQRLHTKEPFSSPGPAAYMIRGLNRHGVESIPTALVSGWPRSLTPFVTPGPGAYRPEDCTDAVLTTAPRFTFGMKTRGHKLSETPAPNAYNIPSLIGRTVLAKYPSLPQYTFGMKTGAFYILTDTPGPAAYDLPSTNIYKLRAPAYTMRDRCAIPAEWGPKPGPADYSPGRVWYHLRSAPRHTFGIKHTQYKLDVHHLEPV